MTQKRMAVNVDDLQVGDQVMDPDQDSPATGTVLEIGAGGVQVEWPDYSTEWIDPSELTKVGQRRTATRRTTSCRAHDPAIQNGLAAHERGRRIRPKLAMGQTRSQVESIIARYADQIPAEHVAKYENMLTLGMDPDAVMAEFRDNLDTMLESR